MAYELLDENYKEQLREDAVELLRFMRMHGFDPVRLRSNLLARSASGYESKSHMKFALQFFDMFTGFVSSVSEHNVDFLLKVLFPTATGYLEKYAGFFMPTSDVQESSTTASKEDKLSIIK